MSVTQTGQPGPMMTLSSFGKVERSPNLAIACSWLPQTCITETGERPISRVTRAIVAARRRAVAGSRNLSWRVLSISPLRSLDLCAHVGGHEVVGRRLAHQRLVEEERFADVLLGDPPDREPDVIEDVVSRGHRLVDDVEAHFPADSPEVDDRDAAEDGNHLSWYSQAHQRISPLTRAAAATAWPSDSPPSPGGTRR